MNGIVSNLNAAIDFFRHWLSQIYDILMVNPISYQDGAVWEVVGKIYDALLGPAVSIFVSLFFLGVAADVGEFIKTRRVGAIVWTFAGLFLMAGILIGGKYLLLLIFWTGREIMDTVAGPGGSDLISLSWIELPQAVVRATDGVSIKDGIVFWVVTLICALVVMVSGFSIIMVVYGRLFKIYMHIAVAPLAMACVIARPARPVFSGFIRSFIGTCLEGLVIVAVCMIFSAFANGFQSEYPVDPMEKYYEKYGSDFLSEVDPETLPEEEREEIALIILNEWQPDEGEMADLLWGYLSRLSFLYLLLAGLIKGADTWLHQKMNL